MPCIAKKYGPYLPDLPMSHCLIRPHLYVAIWRKLLDALLGPTLRSRRCVWGADVLLICGQLQPVCAQAQAPVQVSGTVRDEVSGESLPGATAGGGAAGRGHGRGG
jgi:hypothetical protein